MNVVWLLIASFLPQIHGKKETRYIDDTYGDLVTGALPSYSSDGVDCWNKGPGCAACTLQPQASQAYNGTWHDTTSNVCNNTAVNNGTAGHSVTFTFQGMSNPSLEWLMLTHWLA